LKGKEIRQVLDSRDLVNISAVTLEIQPSRDLS
jgi:hypothetical protein